MDTQRRRARLLVRHAPPKYLFTVLDRDQNAAIKQPVASGTADTLEEIELAEVYAMEHLSREINNVTVPFCLEELTL